MIASVTTCNAIVSILF